MNTRNRERRNVVKKDGNGVSTQCRETQSRKAVSDRARSAVALTGLRLGNFKACAEALATHAVTPLAGVIATKKAAQHYASEPAVAPVDRLDRASWWTDRSESVRLVRTVENYLTHLNLILRHANSIMFIDPHIDLSAERYKEFVNLLLATANRTPRPRIEVHRVCYRGSGSSRVLPDPASIEAEFREELEAPLGRARLAASVFLWDDFHDRYVITDIIGVGMQNGLDAGKGKNDITTWSRMGRKERDDVQREFDPASGRHKLRHRFNIP